MLNTKKQSGATLFICLVLLLGISIVSLAAMRTSVLDLTIANNKQQFANTFEAAEEVINQRISAMSLNITGTETTDQVIAEDSSITDTSVDGINSAGDAIRIADVESEVLFRTTGPASGWQLNQSGSAYHFQMNVNAQSPGRGANSNHRIGFYIIAPGGT